MKMATTREASLDSLPFEPLLQILSYLDYSDLVSCCQVCKHLQELAEHDLVWKKQCARYWDKAKCETDQSWRSVFIHWYNDYGKYITVYPAIRKAWDQIENYTQKHCPAIYDSLQAGLSEDSIDTIEITAIKKPLPLDLRCAYRIHNGQEVRRPGFSVAGLMGSVAVSSHVRSETLLPLQYAADNLQRDTEGLEDCLPLTVCFRSHVSQLIALSDETGYTVGQIFYPSYDSSQPDHDEPPLDNFLTGSSFLQWFTTYAQHLEDDSFQIIQRQIYRLYTEPKCVAMTGSIKVSVATSFMPELSTVQPPNFFHVYYIRMSMAKDAPISESCQLDTRHWTIEDEDGQVETVEGPGVVGEYPVMKPGAEYTWTSCTTFQTTYGTMRGYFTMTNLQTGAPIQVTCPVFPLKCLPYQTSAQRKDAALRRKKQL